MKIKTFGEWLRSQLWTSGMSMAWMSKELGCSQSLLTHWRKGKNPRVEYILQVCFILAKLQNRDFLEIFQEVLYIVYGIDINEYKNSNQKHKKPKR